MKRKPMLVLAGLAGLVLLLAVLGPTAARWLGGAARGVADGERPGAPNPADDRATAEAFLADVPTRASSPTATYSPAGGLVVAVNDALGSSNREMPDGRKMTAVDWREGEETVRVVWAVDDNFAALRRAGALQDVFAILRAVEGAGIDYREIVVSGTFTLADEAGNVAEREAIGATFDRTAVGRANWDTLSPMDVLTLAETYFLHHELE